jgi:site-specific DNA recombinase
LQLPSFSSARCASASSRGGGWKPKSWCSIVAVLAFVLLSFAQFEREIAGERIRDKIAASKKKGMWMGGNVPLGYDVQDRKLIIIEPQAATVRLIFRRYAELGSVALLKAELDRLGIVSKRHEGAGGRLAGGQHFSRGSAVRH